MKTSQDAILCEHGMLTLIARGWCGQEDENWIFAQTLFGISVVLSEE